MIIAPHITDVRIINKFKGLEEILKAKCNNRYDFSEAIFEGKTKPIKIICPEHGEFWQSPKQHLQSVWGCVECAKVKYNKLRSNKDEFIQRAREIHGDLFSYSEVEYINANTRVKIWCKNCGEYFMQKPQFHLYGQGCIRCVNKAQTGTTESFISKATLKHGLKYDYSKVEYIKTSEKVNIICPEHGIFSQRAACHLRGSGCPSCVTQYNTFERYKDTPTMFYTFKYKGLFKIGVTTKNVKDRYKDENLVWDDVSELIEIPLDTFPEAYMFEQFLITKYQEYRYYGKKIFKNTGNTEVFTENIYELYLQECKND